MHKGWGMAGAGGSSSSSAVRYAPGRDSFFADVVAAADSARFTAALVRGLRDRLRGTQHVARHPHPSDSHIDMCVSLSVCIYA
jgi:hypothetical protein